MKVVELFAGVGGFQLALKNASNKFEFVFANQWEPGKSKDSQYAFKCLIKNFSSNKKEVFSNEDISIAKLQIPNDFDLLVGGFPCQDYSVASTGAKGIEGKKGVLWWEISWIIKHKNPRYVFLENVDRLLMSPKFQRGRDFAIMLKNLDSLGYDVEWRVINAAEYGFQQRRRRVFIIAVKRKNNNKVFDIDENNYLEFISKKGIFSNSFEINVNSKNKNHLIDLNYFSNELEITEKYTLNKFLKAGIMSCGKCFSFDYEAKFKDNKKNILKNFLDENFDNKYILTKEQLEKIKYLKGPKSIERIARDGKKYLYKEGCMKVCEDLNKPARTMLTSESSINRSSHIINIANDLVRFITPTEAERINGFPDNWTQGVMPEKMRYFCMGNALVVPLVEKIAKALLKYDKENK